MAEIPDEIMDEVEKLIKELHEEKDSKKQIKLLKSLRAYSQDERVNDFLLPFLSRDLEKAVRLQALDVLNFDDEEIINPLIKILQNPDEEFPIREKVAAILGESGEKKALNALLKVFKEEKDLKVLDNIAFALTFFNDRKVIKPLLKALRHEELRLPALTGLARNESVFLESVELIDELLKITSTNRFEKLHLERIAQLIFDEFGYSTREEAFTAIEDKSIKPLIEEYKKKQQDVKKLLRKVDL